VEEQIRRTHGLPPIFPSVSAWTKAMIEPFASAFSARPPEPPGPPPTPIPPAEGRDLPELVRELQQQVAELRKKRAARKPARRRGKKR